MKIKLNHKFWKDLNFWLGVFFTFLVCSIFFPVPPFLDDESSVFDTCYCFVVLRSY